MRIRVFWSIFLLHAEPLRGTALGSRPLGWALPRGTNGCSCPMARTVHPVLEQPQSPAGTRSLQGCSARGAKKYGCISIRKHEKQRFRFVPLVETLL